MSLTASVGTELAPLHRPACGIWCLRCRGRVKEAAMRTLGSDPRHGGTTGGGRPSAPRGRWRLGLGLGGALLAGVVNLAFGSVAWSAGLTDAEFKCQASVSKAETKFTRAK